MVIQKAQVSIYNGWILHIATTVIPAQAGIQNLE